MRRLPLVALTALLVATTAAPAGAIHRGYDAPMESFRFMVSLRLGATPESHRCGGTLIKPDIVLTAAHCVAGVAPGALVAVVGSDVPDWATAPPFRRPATASPRPSTLVTTTATTSLQAG